MKTLPLYGAIAALLAASNAASNATSSSALLSSGNVQLGDYQDAYGKAKAFVAQLTNSQKISVITGDDVSAGNVSWTALTNKDGFAGINYQYFVSGFPMGNALAMTWNRSAMHEQAHATGREFYLMGYNLINGPVVGPLGRTPWGGRQPEAFSPDPYLSGAAMAAAVRGMNEAGVVTAGRHFLLNEQETNRSSMGGGSGAPYSSNADDKTIHELYLWPFADGVRAGMGAVMCGMTKVNGTLSCENHALVSRLLKQELGFPGMVFPDVNSQSTAFGSANAGLDYGSSTYWSEDTLVAGIANGSFTQERLDDMAVRNVIGYYFAGLDDGQQPSEAATTEYRDVRGDHAKLIRRTAAESLALLKNNVTAGLGLPLMRPRVISIFGAHAGPCMVGPNRPFSVQGTPADVYQGHLASAVGSGQLSLPYLATPFQALGLRAAEDGSMFRWILNDTYSDDESSSGGMGGMGGMPSMGGNASESGGPPGGTDSDGGNSSTTDDGTGGGANLGNLGQGTAVTPGISTYASDSDTCLVFLNADSGEGADRGELTNADQDTLATTVASSCNNTIVILNVPGPRLLEAFADHPNVTAILYGGYLGQESGNAIEDVLYGAVNPSGKLINTIARNESDYPVRICETSQCDFDEGVDIDYRHFDARNTSVRYPFGHGLSYTTFAFSSISAQKTHAKALESEFPTGALGLGGKEDLFDEMISVTATLRNTGERAGAEVAQLYIKYPESAGQPVKQLRGFEKVFLEPGEEREVEFAVRRRDVSAWDVGKQEWRVARGVYGFGVGASSGDVRGWVEVEV